MRFALAIVFILMLFMQDAYPEREAPVASRQAMAAQLRRAAVSWAQPLSMRERKIVTIEANMGSETAARTYAERWLASDSNRSDASPSPSRILTVGSHIALDRNQDFRLVDRAIELLRRSSGRGPTPQADDRLEPSASALSEFPVVPSRDMLGPRARTLSARFRGLPEIERGIVRFTSFAETHFAMSARGEATNAVSEFHSIDVECLATATDGGLVSRSYRVTSKRYTDLGADDVLSFAINDMIDDIRILKQAAPLENYSGPVIFDGMAAPQMFAFVIGSFVSRSPEGDLIPAWIHGPSFLRVFDMPREQGAQYVGSREYGEFGAKSHTKVLVDKGRALKTSSTDYLRSMVGSVHALPSNVRLESDTPLPPDVLLREAFQRSRRAGYDYVLMVERLGHERIVSGDGAALAPAVEVAYKLYPNGSKERVRVGRLHALTLNDLRKLVAVGSVPVTYGELWARVSLRVRDRAMVRGIPFSVTSPPLLIDDVRIDMPMGNPLRAELSRYLSH